MPLFPQTRKVKRLAMANWESLRILPPDFFAIGVTSPSAVSLESRAKRDDSRTPNNGHPQLGAAYCVLAHAGPRPLGATKQGPRILVTGPVLAGFVAVAYAVLPV